MPGVSQYIYSTMAYFALSMWVGAIVMACFGALLRVRVRGIRFGFGPRLLAFRLKSTVVWIGAIPFSASVTFADSRFDKSVDPKESMASRPKILRFMVALSGVLIVFIPGLIAHGPDVFRRAVPVMVELILGGLSPFGRAQETLLQYIIHIKDHGFFSAISLFFAGFGLFLLIPFAASFGLGQALVAIRNTALGPLGLKWSVLTAILCILLFASWMVASLYFLVPKV